MTINDLRAGMLVRRVTTGKVYRVNAHYGDSPAISTNDNGTWVSVRAQRDGIDFGRVRGFHPEELEPVRREDMTNTTRTIRNLPKPSRLFGRLYLRLDHSETPAMVFVQSRGRTVDSGTYWRVLQEGFDSIELTDAENDWLLDLEEIVDSHMSTIPLGEA